MNEREQTTDYQSGYTAGLDVAVAAVRAEPELPGPMPQTVRDHALADPEEFARSVVRAAKRSIIERILGASRRRHDEP